MIKNCINKQNTRKYFNTLILKLSNSYLFINNNNNNNNSNNNNNNNNSNNNNNNYNKYQINSYSTKPPKYDPPEEKSNRAIKRERQYSKLLTLPGRNLKQQLKILKDNPIEMLKKVKEETMSEFLDVELSDVGPTTIIGNENLNEKEIKEKQKEIKKIKNQIVFPSSPEETSFDNIYKIDCLSKMNFAIHEIKKEKLIGLDIEAIEMGKKGDISLVQISIPSGRIFIFDIILMGGNQTPFKYGLKEILESKKILKIVHDCRRDSEVLFHRYQVQLDHIYDVQIAHALVQKKVQGNVPIRRYGFSELIDLYTSRKYSEICVDIKFKVKKQFESDPTIWGKRPLSKDFLDYASLDAACLLPVYYQIKPKLQTNFDRRFLKAHFGEQLTYFKDSIRQLYPRNLI
ncbi:hypothetical protein ACTA71_008704 [Dictyostelium dimigraforme]